ncbi:MAG: hypothetical protein ACTS44_00805 [Candidatus Hodgkinia cicadicola]
MGESEAPIPRGSRRYLTYGLAWLGGIDIFNRTMYGDGAFNVLRSDISERAVIFADSAIIRRIVDLNGCSTSFGSFLRTVQRGLG